MELFNLLAKLTLDTTEYEKSIQAAENAGSNIDIESPELTLDTDDFDDGIDEANDATVNDKKSELALEDEQFQTDIEEDEKLDVTDKDSDLTLEDDQFQTDIGEDEKLDVTDKDADLTLEDDDYQTDIAADEKLDVSDKDASLTLDDDQFGTDIATDDALDVSDKDADLTLDDDQFTSDIDADEKLDVSDKDASLTLDDDQFNEALDSSKDHADSFGEDMTSIFKGIKGALVATGVVGMVLSVVNGIKQAVEMTSQTADAIDKGSKRLGVSRKAYQEWDHALQQSGSSIDDVKKGLMNMQLALQAANPATMFADAEDAVDGLADKTVGLSQDAYEAMRDLGLLDRLKAGEFQKAEQLMSASLKALAGFEGSTDDRGILVRKLFGKGGDNLNALLDEGEAGIDSLLNEASNLGLIMTDDEINNAVAYGDAVANLQKELDAIKEAFVANIIPVLTDAVGWLTEFLAKMNPRNKTNSVFDIFDEIDKKTVKASEDIDEATVVAKDLIEDLKTMGDYWTLDDQGKMTWDSLAKKALELFPQLSDYIDKDGKKIQGNTKDIEENIDAWARLEKQRLLSSAMEEKKEAVAQQLISAYEKGAEASFKEDEAHGKKITALKRMEEFLKNNPSVSALREALEREYGYTGKMTEDFFDKYGDQIPLYLEQFGSIEQVNAYNEWKNTEKEAENLREESQGLIKDAEEAKSKLDEYQKKLEEQMGLTSESVQKTKNEVDKYTESLNKIPTDTYTTAHFTTEEDDGAPKAIGDAYIPYDNYPALLHRGERVLTATEVRRGEGSGTDFTGLEDKIIAAIRAGMDGATVRSYINGREVTEEVNRENMRGVKGRRFAT